MIGRKSLLIVISRFASAGLAFIGLYFMTRYYTADVYGSIAWTLSFINTFNSITDLGFNAAHIKRISEGRNINECLSTFLVVKSVLISIMILVILLAMIIWSFISETRFSNTQFELILLFLLYVVFYDLASIATATFDARVETAKTQLSVIADPLVRIPLIAVISINKLDVNYLAYAYVLGGLAVAVISLFILSRGKYTFQQPGLFWSYLKFAFPIAMISIFSAISVNADKLLIGMFWTNSEVGFYSASQSTLNLFSVIGTAVSTITFPTFSSLHRKGNLWEVREKTRMAERYISMIATPIVVVVCMFPTEIALILFAEKFVSASGPLRFLSISMYLGLLNGVYASQINAVDRPDITAKLVLASLITNITLLLILVPSQIGDIRMLGLGATGAAVANACATGGVLVGTRFVVKKLTGTRSNLRILLHITGGAILGAVLYGISFLWKLQRWYDLVGYGLVAFCIFSFILFGLGELRREDIKYFRDLINPKEMKDYIKSEFRKR